MPHLCLRGSTCVPLDPGRAVRKPFESGPFPRRNREDSGGLSAAVMAFDLQRPRVRGRPDSEPAVSCSAPADFVNVQPHGHGRSCGGDKVHRLLRGPPPAPPNASEAFRARTQRPKAAPRACLTETLGFMPRFPWPAAAGSRRPAVQAGSQTRGTTVRDRRYSEGSQSRGPHPAAEGRAACPAKRRGAHHFRWTPLVRSPSGGLEGRRCQPGHTLAVPAAGGGCRGHEWPGSREG